MIEYISCCFFYSKCMHLRYVWLLFTACLLQYCDVNHQYIVQCFHKVVGPRKVWKFTVNRGAATWSRFNSSSTLYKSPNFCFVLCLLSFVFCRKLW